MTLRQFYALKLWHSRHRHEHPLEKNIWEAVLTLWVMGWVGAPAALLLDLPWAELLCIGMVFLPGAYVAWRLRLHKAGRLRCDWLTALR